MSESLGEVSDRIIRGHTNSEGQWVTSPSLVRESILSALRNERERCAKVIDNEVESLRSLKYPTSYAKWKIEELPRIARAIREGR